MISEDFRLENGQVCLYVVYLVSTYVVVYSRVGVLPPRDRGRD